MDLLLLQQGGQALRFFIPDDIMITDPAGNAYNDGRQENLLWLSGLLDMRCRLTVSPRHILPPKLMHRIKISCAGAVISYLQRRRAAEYVPGDIAAHTFFQINSIEMFSLSGAM